MERLFRREPKDPETDFGAGFGYRIDVFFVEDLGFLNKFIPKRLREERVSVSGGAMSLV
jgi:hypothetical protein